MVRKLNPTGVVQQNRPRISSADIFLIDEKLFEMGHMKVLSESQGRRILCEDGAMWVNHRRAKKQVRGGVMGPIMQCVLGPGD